MIIIVDPSGENPVLFSADGFWAGNCENGITTEKSVVPSTFESGLGKRKWKIFAEIKNASELASMICSVFCTIPAIWSASEARADIGHSARRALKHIHGLILVLAASEETRAIGPPNITVIPVEENRHLRSAAAIQASSRRPWLIHGKFKLSE